MADTDRTKDDAVAQLFDHLDDVRAGMLGVHGSGQHMQPMAHNIDRDARKLWFITASDSDLVKALESGGSAHYCVIGKKQDYYACLEGKLRVSQDEAKLDEVWNVVAAAWFDKGREDARVTLLEMDLGEAAIWSNTSSAVVFGIEIMRANMSEERKPDVGEHRVINLAA